MPPSCESSLAAAGAHSARISRPHSFSGTSLAVARKHEARLASARRDAVLVARDRGDLGRRVGRALGEQAIKQEDVEEAAGRRGDADRRERVEVHEAHLDILDAALAQGVERTLAGADAPLRADLAVELVLDLQERGCELAVFAVAVL
jgi:hypothetical protein